ncbi:MAG: M20/M25/M40 family metallo-hydrolase [Anaerolineae bacterium]
MTASTQDITASGLRLLRELIQIPSPSGEERPAVEHLVAWLRKHGFCAYRDAAGNAIGVLQASGDRKQEPGARGRETIPNPQSTIHNAKELLLLGHIDTVRGFPRVRERDGRLYGRGAVDAKGPLAAFATAAALVGPRPGWRIVVIGAVEEEAATSKGARYLVGRHRPDMVVIGEPTGWQRMALGYKGRLLADVAFQRMMSHTAGPATSAPELAFAYWRRVQELVEELNTGRERLWEQVQASLRHFASEDNGLLETANLHLGFRLPESISPETFKGLLISADGRGTFRFSGEERAYRAEKNTPLVRAFVAAVRSQGGEPGFLLKTGTSDMNVVGPAWNCPILAYGPGDSSLDHTPEEHVKIAEWLHGVEVLADALRRLTEPSPPA